LIRSVPADVISLLDSGLNCQTTYYYRVRAFNTAGFSPWSNEANGTTLAAPPEAPSDLVVESPTTFSLQLDWIDRSDSETGFQIERSGTEEVNFQLISTTAANISFFVDIGLSDGTSYFYRIRAARGGSFSEYSNVAAGTTLLAMPATPGNLTVTEPTFSSLRLNWVDHSDNETGFQVERSMNPGGEFFYLGMAGEGEITFLDTGLEDETRYYYRVRAMNEAGGSGWSNEAYGTTLLGPPIPPSNLTVKGTSSTTVELNWEDRSDNESGFLIERFPAPGGSGFFLIDTAGPNVTSFINEGLEADTEYRFRVRAGNNAGQSPCSNEAACRTWPPFDLIPSDSLLLVYPNPSNGILIVSIRNPGGLNETADLYIAGLDGKRILSMDIELSEFILEKELEIHFSPVHKSGIYTMILYQGTRVASKRFLLITGTGD
jgi:predicted phage tail protein